MQQINWENLFIKYHEEKDINIVKRQIYVALTRAKRFCTFSYSRMNLGGNQNELAHIIAELPSEIFDKKSYDEVEKEILNDDPKMYVVGGNYKKDEFSPIIKIFEQGGEATLEFERVVSMFI